jgi:hypothetical protein
MNLPPALIPDGHNLLDGDGNIVATFDDAVLAQFVAEIYTDRQLELADMKRRGGEIPR